MKLTAVAILAALSAQRPVEFREDPRRLATIAVAIELVAESDYLRGALATAVIKESGAWRSVHTGEKRGKAGEICLVQIHPVNTRWKRAGAPSFEALAGTSLQNTIWCLRTGYVHLKEGLAHCLKRNYKRNRAQAMWSYYHFSKCWLSPHAHRRTALMNKIIGTKWEPTDEMHKLVNDARVYQGFTSLPPAVATTPEDESWRVLLKLTDTPDHLMTERIVRDAYIKRISEVHPDKGGSDYQAVRVNKAYEAAKEWLAKCVASR